MRSRVAGLLAVLLVAGCSGGSGSSQVSATVLDSATTATSSGTAAASSSTVPDEVPVVTGIGVVADISWEPAHSPDRATVTAIAGVLGEGDQWALLPSRWSRAVCDREVPSGEVFVTETVPTGLWDVGVVVRCPDGDAVVSVSSMEAEHIPDCAVRYESDNGWLPVVVRGVEGCALDSSEATSMIEWAEGDRRFHVEFSQPPGVGRMVGWLEDWWPVGDCEECATDQAPWWPTTVVATSGWMLLEGDLLVAGADGVALVRGGDVVAWPVTSPTETAVADGTGGIIVLPVDPDIWPERFPQPEGEGGGVLWRVTADGAAVPMYQAPLLREAPGPISFWEVAEIPSFDGEFSVVFTEQGHYQEGWGHANTVDLMVFPLGRDFPARIADWDLEGGITGVSWQQDRFVVSLATDGGMFIEAVGILGGEMTLPGNPAPFDREPEDPILVGPVVAILDTALVAYIESADHPFRATSDLVIVDLDTGEETVRVGVAGPAAMVKRLHASDEAVVISTVGGTGSEPPIAYHPVQVFHLDTGVLETLEVAGSASVVPLQERRIGLVARVVAVEFGDDYTMTPDWGERTDEWPSPAVTVGPATWITADGSRVEVPAGTWTDVPPICDELMRDEDLVGWSGDPAYMVNLEQTRAEMEPCVVAAQLDDDGRVVWFDLLPYFPPYSAQGLAEIPGDNLVEVRGDGTALTSGEWVLPIADDMVVSCPSFDGDIEGLVEYLDGWGGFQDLLVDLDTGELAEVVCIPLA